MQKRISVLFGLFVALAHAQCPDGWSSSVAANGKCYQIVNVNRSLSNVYAQYVQPCRELAQGADIAAVANAFQNQEIIPLLIQKKVTAVNIGFTIIGGEKSWISAAGFTTYTNGHDNDTALPVTSVTNNGVWQYEFGIADYSLCQLFVSDQNKWPAPLANCPSGWDNSMATPQKCVRSLGSNVTYFDAAQLCAKQDAEVLSLNRQLDAAEAQYLGQPWLNYVRADATSPWLWAGVHQPSYRPNISYYDTPTGLCSTYSEGTFFAEDCTKTQQPPLNWPFVAVCELYP